MNAYNPANSCALCPRQDSRPPLISTGPVPCDYMFVGSAPGRRDRYGPYEGYAAREFDRRFLPAIGLDRERVYLTNVAKCPEARDSKGQIADDIVSSCVLRWFWREIETVNPRVIVLMGADACKLLRPLHVDLAVRHGMPMPEAAITIGGRTYPRLVVPIMHPTGVDHEPSVARHILDDFAAIRDAVRGTRVWPEDEHPRPLYREITDPDEIDFWWGDDVALDTETLPSYRRVDNYRIPWSIQFTSTPGTGFLVAADNGPCIKRIAKLAARRHWRARLHNGLYDIDIMARMGIQLGGSWQDTMQVAYHTGQYMQSLKVLASRLCGMEMQEIADLIAPYAADEALSWLIAAGEIDWGKATGVEVEDGKGGTRIKQPQPITTKIRKALADYGNPAKGDVDLRKRWFNIPDYERQRVQESELGPMPLGSIALVPRALAVWYACRDTDATWRVGYPLGRIAAKIARTVRNADDIDSPQRTPDAHTSTTHNDTESPRTAHNAQYTVSPHTPTTQRTATPIVCALVDAGAGVGGLGGGGGGAAQGDSLGDDHPNIAPGTRRGKSGPDRLWGGVRLVGRPSPANIRRLDQAIVPMVARMRNNGMLIDRQWFADLHTRLKADKRTKEALIADLTGTVINLGSPDQVAKLLYDDLKFTTKGISKTDSGKRLAIDDDAIGILKPQWPELITAIEDWREFDKLEDSYVVPIPAMVGEDGRLRTDLKLTRVSSGRISSSEPNLMAIPTRTDNGREVRKGFIAGQGRSRGKLRRRVLVSNDESQIEMRLAAHYSGDANLSRIFLQGLDVHAQTASGMFRLPVEQLDKWKHRYPAKRVGFGVLFGITAEGLLRQMYAAGALNWTLAQCEELIELWFGIYPSVQTWMADQARRARRYGMVWDLFGRIRYIPEVRSSYPGIQADGDRAAGSMPIQSSAQGTMKLAMAEIDWLMADYRAQGWYCEPLIQIHDDLVAEMDEEIAEEYKVKVNEIVAECVRLDVPIKADGKIAAIGADGKSRWGDMVA